MNGWERLLCPFFRRAGDRVLTPYLELHGFNARNTGRLASLTYARADVLVDIAYEIETYPNYVPGIALGFEPGHHVAEGVLNLVPMWFLIPESVPEHSYTSWTFRTESDLDDVLTRIRGKILEQHARPFWKDPARLEDSVARFSAWWRSQQRIPNAI